MIVSSVGDMSSFHAFEKREGNQKILMKAPNTPGVILRFSSQSCKQPTPQRQSLVGLLVRSACRQNNLLVPLAG